MEVEEYARIAAVEDDHWWYRNTRGLAADLLAPWLHRRPRVLDAGCGPGGNGAWLANHGDVVGVDLSPDALAFVKARRPATVPVRASVETLPFASGSFDAVVGLTILYTVPDDARALAELARVVRRGGAVLLIEPAFAALGRAHDATVHGRRRYRRGQLAELATAAGLTVERGDVRVLVPRTTGGGARSAGPRTSAARGRRRVRRRPARPRPGLRTPGCVGAVVARPPRPARRDVGRAARYPLTPTGRRPRRRTTSWTQSPANPHNVRAIAPTRKNSDFPCTRR